MWIKKYKRKKYVNYAQILSVIPVIYYEKILLLNAPFKNKHT